MNPLNLQISNPRGLYVASIVLFVVGFVLLSVAGLLIWRTSQFIERSQSAAGTATALVPVVSHSDDGSNGKATYAPVFSFKAGNGKTYSVTSSASNDPPAFSVGDDVSVLYEASDPMNARIGSTFQLWGVPLILGPVGAFMALIASTFTLILRSVARRNKPISASRTV